LLVVSNRYFPERAPDLLDFFKNFNTDSAQISEAMAYQEETGENHAGVAIWFMKQNDRLLDEWLAPEQAKRVRGALAGY
jgi:glycine betaine/proline transport system substrate-binding protein